MHLSDDTRLNIPSGSIWDSSGGFPEKTSYSPPPTSGGTFTMPPSHSGQAILPLSNSYRSVSHSPPLSARKFRSSTRRLSYTVKNRAGRYALPLSIGSIVTLLYLILTWSRSSSHHYSSHKVKLYTREQFEQVTFGTAATPGANGRYDAGDAVGVGNNGVSKLEETEDELIAEDDLFWMNYKEPTPLSPEEKAAEEEMEARRQDVIETNRIHSLRALVWWLSEGGTIPNGFKIPSKQQLDKVGGRGMERMLDGIDREHKDRGKAFGLLAGGSRQQLAGVDDNESVFTEGWAEFAKTQFKLVVFSKTYCPYSKRAKSILSKYSLTPAPFIVELDRRSDTGAIQNILHHLTGRRTVPNVLLNFKSLGGADELTLLDAEGGLQRQLDEAAMMKPLRNPYIPDDEEDEWTVADVQAAREADKLEQMEEDERLAQLRDAHVAKIQADLEEDHGYDDGRHQADDAAPVDIQEAVRLAHLAVDRKEGYGKWWQNPDIPEGWIRGPDGKEVFVGTPDVDPDLKDTPGLPEPGREFRRDERAGLWHDVGAAGGAGIAGVELRSPLDGRDPEMESLKARLEQLGAVADNGGHEPMDMDDFTRVDAARDELPPVVDFERDTVTDSWPLRDSPEVAVDAATSTLDEIHPYPASEFLWPETDGTDTVEAVNMDDGRPLPQDADQATMTMSHAEEDVAPHVQLPDSADTGLTDSHLVIQAEQARFPEYAEEDAPSAAVQDAYDLAAALAASDDGVAHLSDVSETTSDVVLPGSVDLDIAHQEDARDHEAFSIADLEAELNADLAEEAASPAAADQPFIDTDVATPTDGLQIQTQDQVEAQDQIPKSETDDVRGQTETRDPADAQDDNATARRAAYLRERHLREMQDRRDRKSGMSNRERFIKAPPPRHLQNDGVAALAAAANLRRRPDPKRKQ